MHADGTPYGSRSVEPKQVSIHVDAFEGLKSLGFRARDARRAVDRTIHRRRTEAHVGRKPSLQEVMTSALELLQPVLATDMRRAHGVARHPS